MSGFYCDIRDNVVKRKNKKKQFFSKSQVFLYSSVVHRNSIKSLRQDEVEKTI